MGWPRSRRALRTMLSKSRWVQVVISPASTTWLPFTRVSQATRAVGSLAKQASTMESEM